MPKAQLHTAVFNGRKCTLPLRRWAVKLGITHTYFRSRFARNMTMQEIVDEYTKSPTVVQVRTRAVTKELRQQFLFPISTRVHNV